MDSYAFWRDLEARFRALHQEQLQHPGQGALCALWDGQNWHLSDGYAGDRISTNFRRLARSAAVRLGHTGRLTAVSFWLDLLKAKSGAYRPFETIGNVKGKSRSGGGRIELVCSVSAEYCLEAETEEIASQRTSRRADRGLVSETEKRGNQSAWAKLNQAEIDAKLEVFSIKLRQERRDFIRDRLTKVEARAIRGGSLPVPLVQPTDVCRAKLDAEVDYLDRLVGRLCATVEQSLNELGIPLKPEDLRDAWIHGIKPRWSRAVTMAKRHVEEACSDMGPSFVKAQGIELEGRAARIHDRHLAEWSVKMEQAKTTEQRNVLGRRRKSRHRRKSEFAGATKPETWSHSEGYVSVTTSKGEKFTLSREQARVIELLDNARLKGNPDVSKSTILEKLERETSRLQDIFRSTPGAWKALIKSTRRGIYRLNFPDPPRPKK